MSGLKIRPREREATAEHRKTKSGRFASTILIGSFGRHALATYVRGARNFVGRYARPVSSLGRSIRAARVIGKRNRGKRWFLVGN